MRPHITPRPPRAAPAGGEDRRELVVLLPVFNDWAALRKLLGGLDRVLDSRGIEADVLVVDDGSTQPYEPSDVAPELRAIRRVEVLQLRRNLGHQRAIAIGLWRSWRPNEAGCRAGRRDGQRRRGRPRADVPRLIARCEQEPGDGARWSSPSGPRRSESPCLPRLLRHAYRLVHRVLTGHGRSGSATSASSRAERLASLVVTSELWNHYAAAAFTVAAARSRPSPTAPGPAARRAVEDELRRAGHPRPQRRFRSTATPSASGS